MNKINKNKIASKLIGIAKRLIGYKQENPVFNPSSANELSDVEEIIIIITDEPLKTDLSRFASNQRITKYSLDEIKQLLSLKPPRIEFKPRDDGKSNPLMLNIQNAEAISIITNLTLSNYDGKLSKNFPNTDVYIVENYIKQADGQSIDLYIKIQVLGKRNKSHGDQLSPKGFMMKNHLENCVYCGGNIITANTLEARDWTHPYRMKLPVRHEICSKCRQSYLSSRAMTEYAYQQSLYRGKLLLKSHSIDSGNWIPLNDIRDELNIGNSLTKARFFDALSIRVFYCIVDHEAYVFKPSFEQYLRVKNGHFWIGLDNNKFYIKGDDIGNTLRIMSVKNVHDFKLDVFFMQNGWITSDLSFLSGTMTSDEFKKLHKYRGYGGLLWKNKTAVSCRKIMESIVK